MKSLACLRDKIFVVCIYARGDSIYDGRARTDRPGNNVDDGVHR